MNKEFTVDFGGNGARLRAVYGVCGAPVEPRLFGWDFTEEYKEMMPRGVRLDARNAAALSATEIFLDISCDPADPTAYDFAEADRIVLAARECGASLLLSLGEYGRRARTLLSRPELLAEIYCGIISHYNEGFAEGCKLGIKYCELFALEGCFGSAEEHAALYAQVSSRIKERFPRLKLGAYSSGGFKSLNNLDVSDAERGYMSYLESFLSALSACTTGAALDFFSWRADVDSPEELALHANYAKHYLAQFGFKRCESILTGLTLSDKPTSRECPSSLASAVILAQRGNIDAAYPFSAYPYSPSNSLFTLDDATDKHEYAAYETARCLGELFSMKNEVPSSPDYRREVYLLAASDKDRAAILLVTRAFSGTVSIEISGLDAREYKIKGILGGGKRGVGYSTEKSGIPITDGKILLKTGKNEVYFLLLS